MAKYVKPTLDTKFHVDFTWWQQKGQNLKAYLSSHICDACKEAAENSELQTFDWINPQTGEVFQIEILWHLILNHCSQEPGYITGRIPLTTAIFRTFIANNNTPLTPVEISEMIQTKSAELILKTIGRRQIYKGIKPFIP